MTAASPSPAVDTVIFDLGGVLAVNGRHSDIVGRFPAEHAAVAAEILLGPYHEDTDHPWHRLERGEITMDELRRLNAEAFAAAGIALPAAPSSGSGSGSSFAFQVSEPMLALVEQLRAAGLRTGVLTNNAAELRPLWRGILAFDDLFDDVVDSSEVGLRKPNPAVYRLALSRLGAVAERTAFLDDVASNVVAAEVVGMVGILVDVDPTAAISQVMALTGLSR